MNSASSLDHPVGAREQSGRNFVADPVCGLEVDDQLETGRLLDRKIGRVGATQDFGQEPRPLPKQFGEARAVGEQPTFFRGLRPLIDRGQAQRVRPFNDAPTLAVQQRRGEYVKG
jgi:hypothetical protein